MNSTRIGFSEILFKIENVQYIKTIFAIGEKNGKSDIFLMIKNKAKKRGYAAHHHSSSQRGEAGRERRYCQANQQIPVAARNPACTASFIFPGLIQSPIAVNGIFSDAMSWERR
jgi:hypothetical protein